MENSNNQIPDDLGKELIDILYKNSQQNYDICALNLIQIFSYLGQKIPYLTSLSDLLIKSFQDVVDDKEINPDISILNRNFSCITELKNELLNGEKNFYECSSLLLKNMNECITILANQSHSKVFNSTLAENRLSIMSLFEILQLASESSIKNTIIELLNQCFPTDPYLIKLLYENTNFASELCCLIKQDIAKHDFLKTDNFINILLETIESEENFLFFKLKDLEFTNAPIIRSSEAKQEENEQILLDILIHLILSINKKFILPNENPVLHYIYGEDLKSVLNRKQLSEIVLKLFNFEEDPLLVYRIADTKNSEQYEVSLEDMNFLYMNPALKFVSDLFSTSSTQSNTSIFYSNDFHVLIDIIVRKLTNLGPNDQVRVDYLSLIQLIIRNSNYLEDCHRKEELLESFQLILSETDQQTIDQDIVKVILVENPKLFE